MKMNKRMATIHVAMILIVAAAGAGFWLLNDGGVRTISGKITRIDQTCQIVRYTDKDDRVIASEESAGCSVADFIEIDDTYTVYTAGQASTDPQDIFEKHDSSWELGDNISLTVLEKGDDNYTLNCDTCGEN